MLVMQTELYPPRQSRTRSAIRSNNAFQTRVQVEQEQELKTKVFSVLSPEREWSGRFTVPFSSSVSGAFGTRRNRALGVQ